MFIGRNKNLVNIDYDAVDTQISEHVKQKKFSKRKVCYNFLIVSKKNV